MYRESSQTRFPIAWRWIFPLVIMGQIFVLLFGTTAVTGAAIPITSNQCVGCHTDAAKLKALTPPDPPVSEEGEG